MPLIAGLLLLTKKVGQKRSQALELNLPTSEWKNEIWKLGNLWLNDEAGEDGVKISSNSHTNGPIKAEGAFRDNPPGWFYPASSVLSPIQYDGCIHFKVH